MAFSPYGLIKSCVVAAPDVENERARGVEIADAQSTAVVLRATGRVG
jgi:hypothetical protein